MKWKEFIKPNIFKISAAIFFLVLGALPKLTFSGFPSNFTARGLPIPFAEYKGINAHLFMNGLIYDYDILYPLLIFDILILYLISCFIYNYYKSKIVHPPTLRKS